MAGRVENLRPWQPGESGNPGGRPKTKPITEELQRLPEQEAPKGKGQTWATVIAEALLAKARKGDVRAIRELADRAEGRPRQAVEVSGLDGSVMQIQHMTDDELYARIKQLEQGLGYAAPAAPIGDPDPR